MAVLERLAHGVERVAWILEHLVEKEHAPVRETDFPGSWARSAADEPRDRDRVMRRAKGPRRRDVHVAIEDPRHRMDGDDLERLALEKARQDPRHAPREQRLPAAGRAGHHHPVRTGGGDLERAPRQFLSDDVREIERVVQDSFVPLRRLKATKGVCLQLLDCVTECDGSADPEPRDQRCLGRIVGRNHDRQLQLRRQSGDRKHAAHGTNGAVERQLANHQSARQRIGVELPGGDEEGHRDRQVERTRLLGKVRGGQVDRDAPRRQ